MNSTQWNILWSAALLPPQSMLPTESLFKNIPSTVPLTAIHLFGFFPSPDWENIVFPEQDQQTECSEDMDDCVASPSMVEFVAFV